MTARTTLRKSTTSEEALHRRSGPAGRSARRRYRFLTSLVTALLLTALAGGGTTAVAAASGDGHEHEGHGEGHGDGHHGDDTTTWHRLDFGGPSHEQISCTGDDVVVCHYEKVPEPELNLAWDSTTARFVGQDITAGWECPEWFPEGVCSQVVRVIGGYAVVHPAEEEPFNSLGNLVVLENGHMWNYFVEFDGACPYFPTFHEALDANPFPLPFNGVDLPAEDCVFAPEPEPAA